MSWVSGSVWLTKVNTTNGLSWNGRNSTPAVLDWLTLSVQPSIGSTDLVFAMTPGWTEYMVESQNFPWGWGGVLSVTGSLVDNTDPVNPVIDIYTDASLFGDGSAGNPLGVLGFASTDIKRVRVATTVALPWTPIYSNGVAWVWATLTRTGVWALGLIDWVTLIVGNRILVKNQTAPAIANIQNGIYVVTALGSAWAPYILTRATDSDATSEFLNQLVGVGAGTVNMGSLRLQTTVSVTVGTSNVVYTLSSPYVTQELAGTQLNWAVPTWNAVSRQLRKGNADFWHDINVFTARGNNFGVYKEFFYQLNPIGLTLNGIGTFVGDWADVSSSLSGWYDILEQESGRWRKKSFMFSPAFTITDTHNATVGTRTLELFNISTSASSAIVHTDGVISINVDDGTGNAAGTMSMDANTLEGYIGNQANANAIAIFDFAYLAPLKTGLNLPSGTALTSVHTVNGSEATNVLYLPTNNYTFDSADSLVPDNTIFVDTAALWSGISILSVPVASSVIGREFTVIHGNPATNVPYQVRVTFSGTDFKGSLWSDYINESPYEAVTYKSVQMSGVPGYGWIRKNVVQPRSAVIPWAYWDIFNAVNRAYVHYAFGLLPWIWAWTVDLNNGDIEIGSKVEVSDCGLAISASPVTVDAWFGNFIISNTSSQTYVMNTDWQVKIFTKVASNIWKVD